MVKTINGFAIRCDNCEWSVKVEVQAGPVVVGAPVTFFCHGDVPVPVIIHDPSGQAGFTTVWPQVPADTFCGRWKAKWVDASE